MKSTPTTHCRLSGEDLSTADLLFALDACPFPGIYPEDEDLSLQFTAPLRVVQAKHSGLVQLADHFDPSMYSKYAFAGGGAGAYRAHLDWFAGQVADRFAVDAAVLEVGTGDGFLLGLLAQRGFTDVCGIDPSRAAAASTSAHVIHGFFPQDLPDPTKKFDLIVCRHVLEHIDDPVPFVRSLANSLSEEGQLWIEVPDLDLTVERELWSNFYQLHCNYFNSVTLDQICASAGLRNTHGEVVEIFGGSILRHYVRGVGTDLPAPVRLTQISARVTSYRQRLTQLADNLPSGAVGYGAAERTAAILGFGPQLVQRISGLFDGNPLLAGRFLAGTPLAIQPKESLFADPPAAIVLFALSNIPEIVSEWKLQLPPETLVAIPSGDFSVRQLRALV